jgi:prepilin-type N-terminal cleavage/methylation domain-containing protein
MQKGYTLVELAISTSILAMLAVGGLSVMGKKNEADNIKETYEKLEKIQATIKAFIIENNFVPCPSAPLVQNSSQLFGYSVRYNTTTNTCNNDAANDGTGDTDINISGGLTAADILTNNTGVVPVRTLGLPDDYMYDGWDRKFTYRIADSAGAMSDFNLDSFRGDIAIVDRRGINKTDINNLPPNNKGAIYVIISHGSNGRDVAWKKNSTTAPASLATGAERKNTNHASKSYVQAPKTETFDDIVQYALKKDVIQPFNIVSPIDLDPLACENASQLIKNGRSSLNAFATSTTTAMADQVYSNALKISKLCGSPLSEKKLPTAYRGLTLWLDADDNTTVFSNSTCTTQAVAGSSNVGCWKDKSGNNNLATQSTGGSQPPYSANQIGSKNALVPSSDHMTISDSASLDSVQNNTFFFVSESPSMQHASIFNKRTTSTPMHFLYALNGLGYPQFGTANNWTYLSVSPHPIGRASILTWSVGLNSPVKHFENGEKLADSTSSIPASLTPDNNPAYLFADPPGNAFPFNGKVGEVILYNATLSDKEREGVELYLSDKWSIHLVQNNKEICASGMEFIKNHKHPEGACQCAGDVNIAQELTEDSACFYGKAFNKCLGTGTKDTTAKDISGQALWLDANDCSTITLSGTSGAVATWADKSPNKFNATQSSDDDRPTYTPKTVSTVNFDGTNDHLTLGSNYIYSANDGLEIFSVSRSDKSGDYGFIYDFGFFANQGYGTSLTNDTLSYYTPTSFGGNHNIISTIKKTTTDFSLLNTAIKFGAASIGILNMSMDGNILATENVSNTRLTASEIDEASSRSNASGPVTIGITSKNSLNQDRWFDGDIGEIIVYDKKLTPYETAKIENYLADKWGILNSPSDLNSLELWLDANDLNTLFTSNDCTTTTGIANNATVGCWKDKSKNTNNAIQATSANRPTLLTSGINSKPALDFDGSTDYLTITNHSSININTDLTAFAVVNLDIAGSAYGILTKFSGSASERQYGLITYTTPNFAFSYESGNNDAFLLSSSAFSVNTTYLVSATVSAGASPTLNIYQDGQDTPTSTTSTATTSTGSDISIASCGAGYGYICKLDGKISEILLFSKALSNSEREYIEQYLGYKWGIMINQ